MPKVLSGFLCCRKAQKDNNIVFNKYEFRAKRTAKENEKKLNHKILLTYDVKKNKNEKELKTFLDSAKSEITYNNKNINQNYSENNNKSRFSNAFDDFLDINIDSNGLSSSKNPKNKYPDFQSFLQLTPKNDIEIPSMKYYNFIFNIGTPSF